MYPTAYETACILAVILKRSEQTRARVSTKTIKVISRRKNLRSVFVVDLITELADNFDWILFELSSGGYGAVQAQALEAAKAVTAAKWLRDEELKNLKRGKSNYSVYASELTSEQKSPDDDDD
jgi:hypothetical protein